MNLFNELPIAFPWYDVVEKQNRFREHTQDKLQDWGLISPKDSLLPFQFFFKNPGAAINFGSITSWQILDLGGNLVATINGAGVALVKHVTRQEREYYYFNGAALATSGGALNLAPGLYYSQITFQQAGVTTAQPVSEIFQVPACTFSVANISQMEFLKLEWWNDTDLHPIFYNDFPGGVPYFRNVVYLDSFIHASEPEIEEDGIKDGADQTVPTFQKAFIRYKITELVPDYLKNALVIMQMHDHVKVTTRRGIRTGEADRISTATSPDFGGALSTIDITFEEDLAMIKKGCGDNMT
jgi:hypothetical protein